MRRHDKEIQLSFFDNEEAVIKELKKVYKRASDDCAKKISDLSARTDMENLQTIIYQKQYQQALKAQLDSILDMMQAEEFALIADYLTKCYEDGFVSVMYSLQQQGIPLTFPIDQDAVVRAVETDSKLSTKLYNRLGEDVDELKKSIRNELSRGIANGSSYNEMAKQIAMGMNSPFKKAINSAIRITRTEGHRIQIESAMDSCYAAKDAGADIVKQWDSSLDRRTRPSHQKVDGEIRELGEKFSNGLEYPGDPGGKASEVVNCRCALLQRAKWALTESELDTLKERAKYFGLDKAENFEDFKKKYLKASQSVKTPETEYFFPDNLTEKANEVVSEMKQAYEKLYNKYGVQVDVLGDKLFFEQEDWDRAFKLNVDEYLAEHPKVGRKSAEAYVRKQMTNRPENVSVTLSGTYHDLTRKIITINTHAINFDMTYKEGEKSVLERLEYFAERVRQGYRQRSLDGATTGGLGTLYHEYGHALDYAKGISEHPKFKEWYSTLTEDDIKFGLSNYALTNDREFIAEAFSESFYSYQRPLSKKFMQILEEILND